MSTKPNSLLAALALLTLAACGGGDGGGDEDATGDAPPPVAAPVAAIFSAVTDGEPLDIGDAEALAAALDRAFGDAGSEPVEVNQQDEVDDVRQRSIGG